MKITESVLSSPIILDEAKELLAYLQGTLPPPPTGWKVPNRIVKICNTAPGLLKESAGSIVVAEPSSYDTFYHLCRTGPSVESLLRDGVDDTSVMMRAISSTMADLWREQENIRDGPVGLWEEVMMGSASSLTVTLFGRLSYWHTLEVQGSYHLASSGASWCQVNVDSDTWYLNGEFAFYEPEKIKGMEKCMFMLTWDQVLMFKDLSASRYICSHTIDQRGSSALGSLSSEEFMWVLDWQEQCIKEMGNDGFGIVKSIESLSKAAIFEGVEDMLEDDLAPLQSMISKIHLKEQAISGSNKMSNLISVFLQERLTRTRALADTFGLMKLSGHPVVYPREGALKVKCIATEDLDISLEDCLDVRRHFCHMFSRGFLEKQGRLPKLSFLRKEGCTEVSSLEELYRSPLPKLNITADNYRLGDWDSVRFCQEYLFDEGEDFLELVSDKALSSLRSEIWETWKDRIEEKVPQLTTSRRALLELLDREEFSVAEIVFRVSQRDIPADWMIVCIFPKEREMKPDPRMFAMMVLEMRTFFVAIEHNLADGIFQHLPQQTMTMSRNDLQLRFLELSKGHTLQEDPFWTVYFELDFTSWNNFMRKKTVNPIARDFNDLYGKLGVFDYIHEFFSQCLIVLRHPAYPPQEAVRVGEDPSDPSICWGGEFSNDEHQGGLEGIFQKGWTAFTLPMVLRSFYRHGVETELMGQADNQVPVARLPKSRYPGRKEVSAFVRAVLLDIERDCKSVGHIIKPEECLVSTKGFTYGKELVINGGYLSTTLKGLSRIFPNRTQDAPTTISAVASIWSGGLAAVERSDNIPLCLSMTLLMTSITLRREMAFSSLHGPGIGNPFLWGIMQPRQRQELIFLISLVPQSLGGIIPGSFLSFLYKGSADPTVAAYTSLCSLSNYVPNISRACEWIRSGVGMSSHPDIGSLLEDRLTSNK